MFASGRSALCCIVLASPLLYMPSFAADQPGETVPPAPVPSQITSGQKVFIANAGVNLYTLPAYITSHTGSPNGLYDEFYDAIKSWGRYELVSAPADADLVFEISLYGRDISADPQLRLTILDPRTHVVLWTFVENVPAGSGREATRRKAWDGVLARLVNDLRLLTIHPANAQAPPK